MSDLKFVPADTLAPDTLHTAFASAFSDYLLGPFNLPLEQWPVFIGRQAADLSLSRAALRDGHLLAFALVAPRPEIGHWRLATMGAVPEARGSGAAPALLDDFIARAAAAGMRGVELECFAQNERAQRLYRARGFEPVHPLYGYVRAAGAPLPTDDSAGVASNIDVSTAFAWLDQCNIEFGDLPLQVTPPSLRAQPVALQAWQRGSAQLVFAESGPDTVVIHSLVDRERGQEDAQALVAQLVRQHLACRIAVPQLQRPDLGGEALERLGFERQPLHQLLMRRPA
ncbi:MAG: GNAT family N-acetyltransferase [Ramlibacter sp.]|nr:GNAT family N-acetyltransferase [Ramlibacter sp.]